MSFKNFLGEKESSVDNLKRPNIAHSNIGLNGTDIYINWCINIGYFSENIFVHIPGDLKFNSVSSVIQCWNVGAYHYI